MHRQTTHEVQRQLFGHSAVAPPCKGRDILFGVNAGRAALAGQLAQLFGRIAAADDQLAAARLQAGVETTQPIVEKRQPHLASVRRVDQPRVDDERRDDLNASRQSGSQRKIVG